MIKILNVNEYIEKNKISEITTPLIFLRTGVLHPHGLHSPIIFDSEEKKKTLSSYIAFETTFIHPTLMYLIKRHHKLLYRGLLELESIVFDKNKFIEHKDGLSGISLLKEIYNTKPSILHDSISTILSSTSLSLLLLDKLLVLPPAFRPLNIDAELEFMLTPLDQKYINLFAHKKSPFYILQPLIQDIYEEVLAILKGKKGIFRSTFLSRRLDFSARLVITVDPTLEIDYVRIPYRVLAMIFAPYLIHYLLHPTYDIINHIEQSHLKLPSSEVEAFKLIKTYYKRMVKKEFEQLIKILVDIIVKDKVIVAKRDPVLHRGGIQAFYPRGSMNEITDIFTMAISPFVCTPFNADFDGDTMAVYAPLTIEGQEEAKKLLPSRNRFSSSTGRPFFTITQDFLLALYIVTNPDLSRYNLQSISQGNLAVFNYPSKFKWQELIEKYGTNWSKSIYVRFISSKVIRTSWGRYVLSSFLNISNFFIDYTITKKMLDKWLTFIYNTLTDEKLNVFVADLGKFVDIVLKSSPVPLSISDFQLPDTLLEPLQKSMTPVEFNSVLEKVMENVKKYIQINYPFLYIIIDSGARGSWKDIQQLMVARGFISSPTGEINLKPILNNYVKGLNAEDIYTSASGWRKGIIDKSLGTADAGYLSRKLTYLMSPIKLNSKDCKTSTGLTVMVTTENMYSLIGRSLVNSSTIITLENVYNFINKTVTLRSPMYCKDTMGGICEVCYGHLANAHKSREIGLLAAQALGEKGTQLVLRTFHTGGISGTQTDLKTLSLPSFIIQKENKLVTNKPFSLRLNLIDDENTRLLSNGIIIYPQTLYIRFEDGEIFEWLVPITLKIFITKLHDVSTQYAELFFDINEVIGEIITTHKDVTTLVNNVANLINSYRGTNTQLVFDLFQIYKMISSLPLVHFEILTSTLTWAEENNSYVPWRYRQHLNPIIVSFIKAIELQSSLLSIMFSNPGKGIEYLLTTGKKTSSALESLIE